jgi:hypothetical protein
VEWYRNGDSAIARLLLHYRMTPFLAYAVKSVRL